MKPLENHLITTHNQGVLGSSPSGTTPKSNYSNVVAFFILSYFENISHYQHK